MKAIFKSTQLPTDHLHQTLLDENELAELRIQASLVQNSGNTSHKQVSREAGWLPTTALGSGMDYAESREYQQGDDPRYINWRLSARSNETFVKTYHMESRPSLCVVLDQRRPMIFGTRRRLKITQALRVATLLAFAAEQQNLVFNVLLINDDIQWLGKQQLDAFLHQTNRIPTINHNLKSPELMQVLDALQQQLGVGSLVYIISDFMDLESLQNSLQKKAFLQLQEQHNVQALHIIDQAEKNLPISGGVSLQSMNSSAKISLDCNKNEVTKGVDNVFEEHLQSVKQSLLNAAMVYAEIQADEDAIHQYITLPLGH